jgi:hypothetical protein
MKGVREIKMPLGKAITRLNLLHSKKGRGIASDEEKLEHTLILDALNKTELSLGFDCDGDGQVDIDDIEIFQENAKTSCCRLIDNIPASSRRKKTPKPKSRSRR